MSSIESGSERLGDDSTETFGGFIPLLSLSTAYGNQVQNFLLAGQWSVEITTTDTGITATAVYDGEGSTTVMFCFKMAAPGDTAYGTLTPALGMAIPLTLTVPVGG